MRDGHLVVRQGLSGEWAREPLGIMMPALVSRFKRRRAAADEPTPDTRLGQPERSRHGVRRGFVHATRNAVEDPTKHAAVTRLRRSPRPVRRPWPPDARRQLSDAQDPNRPLLTGEKARSRVRDRAGNPWLPRAVGVKRTGQRQHFPRQRVLDRYTSQRDRGVNHPQRLGAAGERSDRLGIRR